ncbi:hypothetical protein [Bdellovibrio sp. HCB209]|uniref:hypothetical protein n=1 Tax=Bdellovibrio sp. HCB209 TaxID=3394354 RepID=UPI0039B5A531
MDVKVQGSSYEMFLEGPISEKTALYDYNIKNATELILNLEKVTFINSIGVKNWINWTLKIPSQATITLIKCPFVIVNQVNIVHGFLPNRARVQSFFAPFICESCSTEKIELLEQNKHYTYADFANPATVTLPELTCPKCSEIMAPDFMEKKVFSMLNVAEKK